MFATGRIGRLEHEGRTHKVVQAAVVGPTGRQRRLHPVGHAVDPNEQAAQALRQSTRAPHVRDDPYPAVIQIGAFKIRQHNLNRGGTVGGLEARRDADLVGRLKWTRHPTDQPPTRGFRKMTVGVDMAKSTVRQLIKARVCAGRPATYVRLSSFCASSHHSIALFRSQHAVRRRR